MARTAHSSDRSAGSTVPLVADTALQRPRLLDRVDALLERPLTLVSAPAGYGKTTLAAQWCRQRANLPVTWLDVDPDDDVSRSLASAIDAGDELSSEALARAPARLMVIDDGRTGEPDPLYADLASTIASSEGALRLLVLTRAAPHADLAPLRLRGAVSHLDERDLALEIDEAARLLDALGVDRETEWFAEALVERYEGWIAGLAMVTMTLGEGDRAPRVARLSAGAALVNDYLSSEVIERLPDDLRRFALETSYLDELTGPLCDSVTGREDGDALLAAMRSRGLFVRPSESIEGWFRYHRAFQAALQHLDARARPGAREEALHRAADWFSNRQMILPAARSLVRSADWEALSTLLLTNARHVATGVSRELVELLDAVPIDFHRKHFPLAIGQAGLNIEAGRVTAALESLSLIERYVTPAGRMTIEALRAYTFSWVEEVEQCLAAAERALDLCDAIGEDYAYDDLYNRSRTDHYRSLSRSMALLAGAYAGTWDRAGRYLVDIPSETTSELNANALVRMRGRRASYLALAGRASEARAEANAALSVAERGPMDPVNLADAHYALGEAYRSSAMAEEAIGALRASLDLAGRNDRRNLVAAAIASLAHAHVDVRLAAEALEILQEHRRSTFHRNPATIEAMLAAAASRAHSALGDFRSASLALRGAPASSWVASARVVGALSVGDLAAVREAISDWPDEPTAGSRLRRTVAQAALFEARRQPNEGLQRFRAALDLAAEHDFVQPLTEFGEPLTTLLRRVKGVDPAVSDVARRARAAIVAGGSGAHPLTARETAVMRRLSTGVTLPDLAREMHLSINTVRSHVRSIYRKLGVTSRAEAIAVWRRSARADR